MSFYHAQPGGQRDRYLRSILNHPEFWENFSESEKSLALTTLPSALQNHFVRQWGYFSQNALEAPPNTLTVPPAIPDDLRHDFIEGLCDSQDWYGSNSPQPLTTWLTDQLADFRARLIFFYALKAFQWDAPHLFGHAAHGDFYPVLDSLDESEKSLFYQGIGASVLNMLPNLGLFELHLPEHLEKVSPKFRNDFLLGIAWSLDQRQSGQGKEWLKQHLHLLAGTK